MKNLSRLIVSIPIFGITIATLILIALSFDAWWYILIAIITAISCVRLLDTYEADCESVEKIINKFRL